MTRHTICRDEIRAETSPEERGDPERPSHSTELGAQLCAHRLAAKMTQQELAHASGLSQSVISDIECSKEIPTVPRAKKLFRQVGWEVTLVPPDEAPEDH